MIQYPRPSDERIRAIPYPFKGALSLSSDIEFMDFGVFETLMRFWNTRQETPLGTGLGLEVSSSLFFYTANPYTFSYFDGERPQNAPSDISPRLDEYLKAGWLDTNHAYGDFDGSPTFERAHAERIWDRLDALGVKLDVFTNHGGFDNRQNVGGDSPHHQGDLPHTALYHADLMRQHGVDFLWTENRVFAMPAIHKHRKPIRRFIRQKRDNLYGRLLWEEPLRDGTPIWRFMRLRGTGDNAPNFSSLGTQLDLFEWDELYDQGVVVLYQHLGILDRCNAQCRAVSIEALLQAPEVYLGPFYRLQREAREGRLWVVGQARLLRYVRMVEHTRVVHRPDEGLYEIVSDLPVEAPQRHFQGLTLYVDTRKPVRVDFGATSLTFRLNGPDHTGRYSATIPIERMSDIWC